MQYIEQTGTKKKLIKFDGETFASLSEALDNYYSETCKLKLNVAFASYIQYVDGSNGDTIGFFYHDSPVVQWHLDDMITVNTFGFMGAATLEKINFALNGHAHIANSWDKRRVWLFHGKDQTVRFYDGLTFDAVTGEIVTNEPTTTYADLAKIYTAYQFYGGKKKAPVCTGEHVPYDAYDNVLDNLIKAYVEHVITADNILHTKEHHIDCDECNEQEEVIDRGIGEGDIKPGNFGSIKEQALAALRQHDSNMDHLLQHIIDAKYNSSIVWIALTLAQYRPEHFMYSCEHEWELKIIQRQVSRLLRRLLHKGIVNVA